MTDVRVETAREAVERIVLEVTAKKGARLLPGTEMSVRPELFEQLRGELGLPPEVDTVMISGVRVDGNLKPRGRD